MDINFASLSSFVKDLNEAVFIIDEDRRVVAASDTACSLLGVEDPSYIDIDKNIQTPFLDMVIRRSREPESAKRSMPLRIDVDMAHAVSVDASFGRIVVDGRDLLMLLCHDVSEYTSKIAKLSSREDLYRTIFQDSPLGFIHINSDGYIANCNQELLNIFGYFKEQLIGLCIVDDQMNVIEPRFRDAAVRAVMGERVIYESHFKNDAPFSERQGWVRVRFSPIMSDSNSFFGAVGIVEDITEKKEAEEKIAYIGNHDALTGLKNRRACEVDRREADRQEDMPLSLIYIDLNHLKLANDSFGHVEGDDLLKKCSQIMKSTATERDECYRLGGDEFLVMMKNSDQASARDRAESMIRMCDEWPDDDGIVRPSMALGYSTKTSTDQDLNEVLKEAEDMMYANKLRDGSKVRRRLMTTLESKLLTMRGGIVAKRAGRMVAWGEWLLRRMDLDAEADAERLRLLFRYHDIGLLAHARELDKIGIIDPEARAGAQMQHTVAGYRIARTVAELSPAADLILSHHEYWDGTGYPSQLKGGEIPYLSRLAAIFDALEAAIFLSEERPSFDHAFEMIKKCAGTRFDPEMISAIDALIRAKRPELADLMEV